MTNAEDFTYTFWCRHHREDAERQPHTVAVINGTHYILEPSIPNKDFSGFGGTEFTIKFNDGFVTKCDNLWCQGDIPEEWREKFPDNAEFIWEKQEVDEEVFPF